MREGARLSGMVAGIILFWRKASEGYPFTDYSLIIQLQETAGTLIIQASCGIIYLLFYALF